VAFIGSLPLSKQDPGNLRSLSMYVSGKGRAGRKQRGIFHSFAPAKAKGQTARNLGLLAPGELLYTSSCETAMRQSRPQ
jgi:hypothetical protein